jgi:hypothetical protein
VTAPTLASRLLQYSVILPQSIDLELLIQFAITLQGRIYPPLLAASGAMFSISLVWFTLLKLHLRKGEQRLQQTNQKSLPQRVTERAEQYRRWATISLWVAFMLGLASTLAVAMTSAGIEYANAQGSQLATTYRYQNITAVPTDSKLPSASAQDRLVVTAGRTLIILQWCITACLVLLATGMSIMYKDTRNSPPQPQPISAPKPAGPAPAAPVKPAGAQLPPAAPRPA